MNQKTQEPCANIQLERAIETTIAALCDLRDALIGPSDQKIEAVDDLPGSVSSRREVVVKTYWLNSAGLGVLAGEIGERVDRIGCTSEDLASRLSSLGRDEYGAWSVEPSGLKKHDGFKRWIAQVIHTTRPSLDPAVVVRTRTIDVVLPVGMTRRMYDRALDRGLQRWSLERRHPDVKRVTVYSVGKDRISQALEFYAGLDPRRDGDRLLELIEAIVRDHRNRTDTRSAPKTNARSYPPTRCPNLKRQPRAATRKILAERQSCTPTKRGTRPRA